jgi:hypothetical protein
MLLAGNADSHLIQMPDIIGAWLFATKALGIVRPNFFPHRRIVLYETTIPRSSSISSTSRKLRGTEIQPDCLGNDLGRKPMTLIADGIVHAAACNPAFADQKLMGHHPGAC